MAVEGQQERRGIGLGYIFYQQVAGVLRAFSLIAFFGHFVHLDWRGGLAELVGAWGQFVRPPVKWIFDHTIVALAGLLFHWRVVVPQVIRDYVSVGMIMSLSAIRANLTGGGLSLVYRVRGFYLAPWLVTRAIASLLTMLAWPLFIWRIVTEILIGRSTRIRELREEIESGRNPPVSVNANNEILLDSRQALANALRVRGEGLLTLMPFFYLSLLLAANYLLLKPGT